MSYIEFKEVDKIYQMGEVKLKALDKASFEVEKGELVIILGQSGSGKSTCLNILGGMDSVTSGKVIIDGTDITKLKEKELINFRRNDIGFVFQFYNLVQNLTAVENIELGTQICKNSIDAETALKKVGLEDRIDNFPSQMSGGQQQRVSIARAIARNPHQFKYYLNLVTIYECRGTLDTKLNQLLKKKQTMWDKQGKSHMRLPGAILEWCIPEVGCEENRKSHQEFGS